MSVGEEREQKGALWNSLEACWSQAVLQSCDRERVEGVGEGGERGKSERVLERGKERRGERKERRGKH